MEINKQIEDFKKLTSDVNRWAWIIQVNKTQIETNEEQTLLIVRDNDETYLHIGDESLKFEYSIGDSPGISDLLKALRIRSEMA